MSTNTFKIFSVSGIDMQFLPLVSSSLPVAKEDEKEDTVSARESAAPE